MSVLRSSNARYIPTTVSQLSTAKSANRGFSGVSNLRSSTDAYFYADVTIHNAVIGSRYWLVNNADYSQVLATGIITSTTQTLSNIPSYGSPMLMLLRLRKASSPPYYKTWEGIVPHSKSGADFYVSQEEDE